MGFGSADQSRRIVKEVYGIGLSSHEARATRGIGARVASREASRGAQTDFVGSSTYGVRDDRIRQYAHTPRRPSEASIMIQSCI